MGRWISALSALTAWAAVVSGGAACAQTPVQDPSDPVKLDLARQIVEQSGGQQAAKAQIDAMFTIMKTKIGPVISGDKAPIMTEIYSDLQTEMDGLAPQLLDVSVKVYARNDTEKEMRDILAFEQSETGRSMRSKALTIRSEALNQTMPLVMGLLPEIMRHSVDRACDASHCSAKQRETLAAAVSKAMQGMGR